MRINNCPDVCARAYWQRDDAMSDALGCERGQWNCPYRFGVDYGAAIVNGEVNCVHSRSKEER